MQLGHARSHQRDDRQVDSKGLHRLLSAGPRRRCRRASTVAPLPLRELLQRERGEGAAQRGWAASLAEWPHEREERQCFSAQIGTCHP